MRVLKCIILKAAPPPPPGTQTWLCGESSRRAMLSWSAVVVSPRGLSGADLELTSICALHSHPALCGNSRHFLSDGVSYSDGCTGEWLLSFSFNFVLLFDGR